MLLSLFAGLAAILLNSLLMVLPWKLTRLLYGKQAHPYALFFLIAAWLSLEFLHFHWELAWPWLTLAHAFANMPFYLQMASYTGVAGYSFLILLANLLLFLGWNDHKRVFFFLSALIILFPFLFSPSYFQWDRPLQPEKKLRVRIIQPNIDPYQKFEVLTPEQQVHRIQSWIQKPGLDTIDLVLLPETALPTPLTASDLSQHPLITPLLQLQKRYPLCIVTGFTELIIYPDTFHPPTAQQYDTIWYEIANSIGIVGDSQSYQKAKLVPLVERVPYLEYLTFLKHFYIDLGGSFGNLAKPIQLRNLRCDSLTIAGVICYESVFGNHLRHFVKEGASLIAIVTNDGWWKKSSGYLQHAAFATFRAIENRKYVIRSANTGISLVLKPNGSLIASLPYDRQGYIDVVVFPMENQPTFYTRYGDWLYQCVSIAFFLLLIFTPIFPLLRKRLVTVFPSFSSGRSESQS
jgi:apolipoprotein N-acyltransferase